MCISFELIYMLIYTTVQEFGVGNINIFEGSFLCSPSLYLFD